MKKKKKKGMESFYCFNTIYTESDIYEQFFQTGINVI